MLREKRIAIDKLFSEMTNNRKYLLIEDLINKCKEFNNNLINYKEIWDEMNIYNNEKDKNFCLTKKIDNNEILNDYITYQQFLQYLSQPFYYEVNKIFKFYILQIPDLKYIKFDKTVKICFREMKSENQLGEMLQLLGIKIKKDYIHILINLYNTQNGFMYFLLFYYIEDLSYKI